MVSELNFHQELAEFGSNHKGKVYYLFIFIMYVQHSKFKAKHLKYHEKTQFLVQHLVFYSTSGANQHDHDKGWRAKNAGEGRRMKGEFGLIITHLITD